MLDHKINITPLYKNPKYPNANDDAVPIEEGSYVTFSYHHVFKCGIGNDFIGCGYIKWLDSLMTYAIFFDDGQSLFTGSNYIVLSDVSVILHYGGLSKEEEKYNKNNMETCEKLESWLKDIKYQLKNEVIQK